MKAQAASPTFTNVYAALVAIINTKMPEVGELLVRRLVDQFLKSFRRHNRVRTQLDMSPIDIKLID